MTRYDFLQSLYEHNLWRENLKFQHSYHGCVKICRRTNIRGFPSPSTFGPGDPPFLDSTRMPYWIRKSFLRTHSIYDCSTIGKLEFHRGNRTHRSRPDATRCVRFSGGIPALHGAIAHDSFKDTMSCDPAMLNMFKTRRFRPTRSDCSEIVMCRVVNTLYGTMTQDILSYPRESCDMVELSCRLRRLKGPCMSTEPSCPPSTVCRTGGT